MSNVIPNVFYELMCSRPIILEKERGNNESWT